MYIILACTAGGISQMSTLFKFNESGEVARRLVLSQSLAREILPATRVSKVLRRNAIGNRAISVFNEQKPFTEITLSISQSFLHFLKAKSIDNTKNNFSWELEKINFKVKRNCANTGKISSLVSFHEY